MRSLRPAAPNGPRPAGPTIIAIAAITALLTLPTPLTGCATAPTSPLGGGDPERGQRLIRQDGCGSCHTIPGVAKADGLVGPPLIKFGGRSYIAGKLPNNPENLQRWIQNPQAVDPGVAMPDMGISAVDARDIATYLLSLH